MAGQGLNDFWTTPPQALPAPGLLFSETSLGALRQVATRAGVLLLLEQQAGWAEPEEQLQHVLKDTGGGVWARSCEGVTFEDPEAETPVPLGSSLDVGGAGQCIGRRENECDGDAGPG